jgi:hypothetical protein
MPCYGTPPYGTLAVRCSRLSDLEDPSPEAFMDEIIKMAMAIGNCLIDENNKRP